MPALPITALQLERPPGSRDVVALREVFTGVVHRLPDHPAVILGRDPGQCAIVITSPCVSARHLELIRAPGALRVRSIGRNRARRRKTSIIEVELTAGDWIELADDCWLQAMSRDMLHETYAAAFFLGSDNHYDISLLLAAAAQRRPLVLVGSATAGEYLARRIPRMASRSVHGFCRVDLSTTTACIADLLARHDDVTLYVEAGAPTACDMDAVRALVAQGSPLQLVFGVAPKKWGTSTVPRDLVTTPDAKTEFELVDVGPRRDRLLMALLSLRAHGLQHHVEAIGARLLVDVLYHPATNTLEDVWIAPLRLAALEEAHWYVKPASELLRAWGYDRGHGRSALDHWIELIGIVPSKMRVR